MLARLSVTVMVFGLLAGGVDGGLLGIATYGLCQTGCNTAWLACFAAAGNPLNLLIRASVRKSELVQLSLSN